MRDSKLYLNEMIAALEAILLFVEGISFDHFKSDDKTQSAVIRKFEIIGEAAKAIPFEIKDKYADIPWKSLAGFRDVLIHNYFGIDDELVWQYVKKEVPLLKNQLNAILEKEL